MFVVQIGWLIFLGTLAYVRIVFPKSSPLPDMIGALPVGVVWFGALGAVLISLTGIVEHAKDWDESFALWHLSRPLMGASVAIVAVLIMQAGILAVGSSPTGDPASVSKNILYYLVAFLVGYREETFREMIKRLVDVVFTPPPKPKSEPATDDKQPPEKVQDKGAPPPPVVGPDKVPIAAKDQPKDGKEAPVVPPPPDGAGEKPPDGAVPKKP
jgi:hypothetical protein